MHWIFPGTPDDVVEAFPDPNDRSHCFGDLDHFLLNEVLGDGYREHYRNYADHPWYQLLQRHGLVNETV